MKLLRTPDMVEAGWMDLALQRAGIHCSPVTSVRFEPVGHGLMSDSFRFHLCYADTARTGPDTLVGKFAAVDPTSRRTATDYAIYRSEVDFYATLAPALEAKIPRALCAEIDADGEYFTLLLHDLAPARSVDQAMGCTIEDAELALREMAGIHGQCWNRASLGDLPWAARRRSLNEGLIAALPAIGASFLDRFAERLAAAERRSVARLLDIYPMVLRDRSAPATLQHGDFRLDNLLFDVGGKAGTHILDWANIAWASGLVDISYFIGASLDEAQRAAHEEPLVRSYHDALCAAQVSDYGWEQCWRDYRRFAFLGLLTGVASPMMVESTERSDGIFLAMVRNHARQIDKLDSFSFWD